MENSAPVPESGLWELLPTWLLLQPPAGVSGATARTELLNAFLLCGASWSEVALCQGSAIPPG